MKKLFVILFVLLFAIIANAADSAKQVDFLLTSYLHPDTDKVLSGGKVETYVDGTSTLVNLWTDKDKGGSATNPVVLDAAGKAEIYGDGIYKFLIYDSDDVLLETINGLEYRVNTATDDIANYDSLTAAVASIGAVTETTLTIAEPTTCTANTVVTDNIKLKVENGGTIDQSTFTLDINGPFDCGGYSCFIGSGLVTFGGGSIEGILTEWFGAVADWDSVGETGTDSGPGFTLAALTSKASGIPWKLMAGDYYTTTSTFFGRLTTGDPNCPGIVGEGKDVSIIYGACTGEPVIDFTGARGTEFRSFGIRTTSANFPSIGILFARIDEDTGGGTAPSADRHYLDNVDIRGNFTISPYYNYAAEITTHIGCEFVLTGSAGADHSAIVTETNIKNATSPHVTIAGTANTDLQQSTNTYLFEACDFDNRYVQTDFQGAFLCEGGKKVTLQDNRFGHIDQGSLGTHILWQDGVTSRTPSAISIVNNLFHSTVVYNIYFDTDALAGVTIKGNTGAATSATVACVAGCNFTSFLDIESTSIDFSGANTDINDFATIKAVSSFSIGRIFTGKVEMPSDATLTVVNPATFFGEVFWTDKGITAKYPLRDVGLNSVNSVSETDLVSLTLPGGTLLNNSRIRVEGLGNISGTNGNKTINFYVGSNSVTILNAENINFTWVLDASIMASSTNARINLKFWVNNVLKFAKFVTFTEDFSTDSIIKLTASVVNTSDSVRSQVFTIE